MKILYIPLDERPCNYLYPQYMSNTQEKLELITVPVEILGNKKVPADTDKIWEFVFENISDCDAVVLSIDMLIYGGLIPSRLHKLIDLQAEKYINNIKKIRKINDKIKIYAFNCVMRTPHYNSSEEEPEYYEEFGEAIFKRSYLLDKSHRFGLIEEEENQLKEINIPSEYIDDYENRREFNSNINLIISKLLKEDYIDFLTIPQDDSSEFGYTAIDQKKIVNFIENNDLAFRINIYPGADEVGSALVARAYNDFYKKATKIYPFYASVNGPLITPLYEDRPMYESLKSHIRVVGGEIVETSAEADIILAINSPGKIMQESWDQFDKKDITYTSFRNLMDFAMRISKFVDQGKDVIISDSAFSNGGDLQLIKFLDKTGALSKLISYKGWNTNCNTLGTTLAAGIIGQKGISNEIKKNVVYHILEDAIYQAKIRKEIVDNVLITEGMNYYDFKGRDSYVHEKIQQGILADYKKLEISKSLNVSKCFVSTPWDRMFEISIDIEVEQCF